MELRALQLYNDTIQNNIYAYQRWHNPPNKFHKI